MAKQITREADAARDLLPDGWKWMDSVPPVKTANRDSFSDTPNTKIWRWGTLTLASSTATPRMEAFEALLDTIRKNYTYVKVISWWATGTKIPMAVSLMPIMDDEYAWNYLRSDHGLNANTTKDEVYAAQLRYIQETQHINLVGWDMTDGAKVGPGTIRRDGNPLRCNRCKRIYANLSTDPGNPLHHYCMRCVRQCPGDGTSRCGAPIFDPQYHGCETHFTRSTCVGCNKTYEGAYLNEHDGKAYCARCVRSICARCEKMGSVDSDKMPVIDGHEQYSVCDGCRKDVEKWIKCDRVERLVMEKPCTMVISDHRQRPVRLCSVELEVAEGAEGILHDLYRAGLTSTSNVFGHWRGDKDGPPDFCYMERDGSLPEYPVGGEVVFSKMRLDDPVTANKFKEAIGVIRKHVKDGKAVVDLRTGAHVHIDFHKSGFSHARNVVVLHNFIEDPFYRLSAANYDRHRGVHYATVLPKQGLSTQDEFNKYFFRRGNFDQMHHSVLNVDGFYKAAAECSCGNLTNGDPNDCECQLGKCTVEFRSFNGTSSWKKLHAYVAMCQSLVAYARAHEYLDVDDFPPAIYKPVGIIDDAMKQTWYDRMEWMFQNLYFTSEERENINYCVEHSDLVKLTYAQRRDLRGIEFKARKYVPTKAPAKAAPPPRLTGLVPTYRQFHENNNIPYPGRRQSYGTVRFDNNTVSLAAPIVSEDEER